MDTGTCYLIKNVRLVHSGQRCVENCDILFSCRTKNQRSRVLAVGTGISMPQDRPIKLYAGASRLFCRAFADTASYIVGRGTRGAETYAPAAQAASSGGFSAITLMPTLASPMDTPAAIENLKRDCRTFDVQFLPVAALAVSERGGYRFGDYEELKKAGAVGLGVIEKKKLPGEILYTAMCRAYKADMTVFCPVSGGGFSEMGAVNEGRISKMLRLPGIPACAELLSVNETLLLAKASGCRVHIPVISLAESVQAIRKAKSEGVRVTCGTSAPYFSLTEDDLIFRGVNAKLDPPLRTAADRAEIIEGLCAGTIDCIAGDHRPCTAQEKGSSIATAAFGAAGLETAFAAGFTYLVLSGKMDLYTLLHKLTEAPARILGIAPEIQKGGRMDLVMLDEEKEMIYTNNTLHGRASNTPYYGTALCGAVSDRFIDGK